MIVSNDMYSSSPHAREKVKVCITLWYLLNKFTVIASEAKQSFWPGISYLEIAASLALLAKTDVYTLSTIRFYIPFFLIPE